MCSACVYSDEPVASMLEGMLLSSVLFYDGQFFECLVANGQTGKLTNCVPKMRPNIFNVVSRNVFVVGATSHSRIKIRRKNM